MAESKEITPSGTVGKQVFATTVQKVLCSVVVTPGTTSAAVVVIRDGNASGDVRLTATSPANESRQIEMDGLRFDRGMHVKVTPSNAKAYLIIN